MNCFLTNIFSLLDEPNSLKICSEQPLSIINKSVNLKDWLQIVRVLSKSKQHVKTCIIKGKLTRFSLGSIWPPSSSITKQSRIYSKNI